MMPPATAADMAVSSSSPKLIVSGSRAEQPSPASANTAIPAPAAPRGSTATSTNVTRPTVTMPQNTASANEACVAEAPTRVVRSSWDQLPFIVSQMPYNTAKAAKNQNRTGTRDLARRAALLARAPARNGSRALNSNSATSIAAERTGRPHQNPRPRKMATNTGASAVPSPSSAFSTSTARSTLSGWKTEE